MKESITELAQNMVRQQIANRLYFLFCDLSQFFRSDAIMAEADEKTRKEGINKRFEKNGERFRKTPLIP